MTLERKGNMTLTDKQELARLLALYQQETLEHDMEHTQHQRIRKLLRRLKGNKNKGDESGSIAEDRIHILHILRAKRFKRWVANGGADRAAVYRALVREIPQRPRIMSIMGKEVAKVCAQCSARVCEVQCYCEICGQAIDWRDGE